MLKTKTVLLVMRRLSHLFVVLSIILALSVSSYAAEDEKSACVIVLHGLARTDKAMSKLTSALQDNGYHAVNIEYPSTEMTIDKLAALAVGNGLYQCNELGVEEIHFVTHSMGGILVRQYLSAEKIENLGRVVMLGPPNQGSEVVDKLGDYPGFKLINGPAGMQLGTGSQSVPNQLGAADFEVGVIAGTRSMNLILSTLIPGEDDGKVSVKNAHLENEKDFLALPTTHTFMMRNKEVIKNVLHFLAHGNFIESSKIKERDKK